MLHMGSWLTFHVHHKYCKSPLSWTKHPTLRQCLCKSNSHYFYFLYFLDYRGMTCKLNLWGLQSPFKHQILLLTLRKRERLMSSGLLHQIRTRFVLSCLFHVVLITSCSSFYSTMTWGTHHSQRTKTQPVAMHFTLASSISDVPSLLQLSFSPLDRVHWTEADLKCKRRSLF